MCDYSLTGNSRLAQEQDELQLVAGAHSHGFKPADSHNGPWVCIQPGAILALTGLSVSVQTQFSLTAQEIGVFTQRDLDLSHSHHDAIEFRNQCGNLVTVSLQMLNPGIRAQVRSLHCSAERIVHQEHSLSAANYQLVSR